MKKATFLFVFILACNFIVAQNYNYFIKFEGIPGELTDRTHREWCDLESFDQQVDGNDISGPRRTATFEGKTISIVKKIDKSSPKILGTLTRGSIIKLVEIEVETRIANINKVIYKYELRNVVVTKYNVMGKEPERPMEEITLQFEILKVKYTEYDDSGRSRGSTETEYNVERH